MGQPQEQKMPPLLFCFCKPGHKSPITVGSFGTLTFSSGNWQKHNTKTQTQTCPNTKTNFTVSEWRSRSFKQVQSSNRISRITQPLKEINTESHYIHYHHKQYKLIIMMIIMVQLILVFDELILTLLKDKFKSNNCTKNVYFNFQWRIFEKHIKFKGVLISQMSCQNDYFGKNQNQNASAKRT